MKQKVSNQRSYNLIDSSDPVLRTPTRRWRFEDGNRLELARLYSKLESAMTEFKGVGIAATQLGVGLAIALMPINGKLTMVINPQVHKKYGSRIAIEGCLSIPGHHFYVVRPTELNMTYQDVDGNYCEYSSNDADEVGIISHELDHLDGIVLDDYCIHHNCGCLYVAHRKNMSLEIINSLAETKRRVSIGRELERLRGGAGEAMRRYNHNREG